MDTIINENSIAGFAKLPSGPSTLTRTQCFGASEERPKRNEMKGSVDLRCSMSRMNENKADEVLTEDSLPYLSLFMIALDARLTSDKIENG